MIKYEQLWAAQPCQACLGASQWAAKKWKAKEKEPLLPSRVKVTWWCGSREAWWACFQEDKKLRLAARGTRKRKRRTVAGSSGACARMGVDRKRRSPRSAAAHVVPSSQKYSMMLYMPITCFRTNWSGQNRDLHIIKYVSSDLSLLLSLFLSLFLSLPPLSLSLTLSLPLSKVS